MLLLNKKINSDKSETELEMENHKNAFREGNLKLQFKVSYLTRYPASKRIKNPIIVKSLFRKK